MSLLLLKLIMTPLLIGAVSLVARRFSPQVAGVLVGLPLTSGPVTLFLALEQGERFAAGAALGTLLGVLSVTVFCTAYALIAQRMRWAFAVFFSTLGFVITTLLLRQVSLGPLVVAPGIAAALLIAVRLIRASGKMAPTAVPPWWDIPLRMTIATCYVLVVTALAPVIGPHLSGLVTPFPIFTGVLAVFTQHFHGPQAVARFLRGASMGLFSFAAFFFLVAVLVQGSGITLAFTAASAAALTAQALLLFALRMRSARREIAA